MGLFEWKQEHSVSVSRFDSDHKKLFSILNELNEAMAEKRGRFVVVRILQELADYARKHFVAEEASMRRVAYDGLEHHIAEHKIFIRKIDQFYSDYEANPLSVSIDVLYFLRDWLQNHILHTDRKYAEPLNRASIH